MIGIGCVIYSAFGVGGYWTLLVGAPLVGFSAARTAPARGRRPINDGSLNDWRAWAVLAALVVWFLVVLATK